MTDTDQLGNLRHSLAHLLAAAVMELYPDTKRTIGPAIDNGFYYDFDFSSPISDKDLPKIEKQRVKNLFFIFRKILQILGEVKLKITKKKKKTPTASS